MYILLGVLFAVALFGLGKAYYYRKHVLSMKEQLVFIKEHETNKIITTHSGNAAVNELVQEMNELIAHTHQLKKEYIKQEDTLKETITSLSHDIRTPLTSLDGYFQLLSQSTDPKEQEHFISIIENRIKSLKEMLDELFTYAKLQNNTYELTFENCVVNEILLQTVFSFYDDFTKRGIDLHLKVDDTPVIISANQGALKRVFQNIIKNALEYAYHEASITLVNREKEVVFLFANKLETDSIQVEKVFERFYRTDNARSRNSTGLGLSIVKELVVRMGGEISAKVQNGWFSLELVLPKEI